MLGRVRLFGVDTRGVHPPCVLGHGLVWAAEGIYEARGVDMEEVVSEAGLRSTWRRGCFGLHLDVLPTAGESGE